jgi:DNA-binding CsgD family transcriptional regulator
MLASLAIVREADPFAVLAIEASVASICASWVGRFDLARALRQEVIDHDIAIDVRSRIWFDRATVWGLASDGDSLTAARHAVDGASRAVADTHLVWGAWQLHDAVRLGHAELAAPRLASLAEPIEGTMIPTMALHGTALLEGDPVKLGRASSAFEQMGSLLFAAEAAAQAQRAYLRHGRQRLAHIAGARASLLAARCPGVRTPALADTGPVALTPRELDVARLAALGLPSRELGDRLGISVRTVDNHLGSVYGKLGIGSRSDLSSVFGVGGDRPPTA